MALPITTNDASAAVLEVAARARVAANELALATRSQKDTTLRAMADVLQLADLRDQGILVELRLPLTSKRLDCRKHQALALGQRNRHQTAGNCLVSHDPGQGKRKQQSFGETDQRNEKHATTAPV